MLSIAGNLLRMTDHIDERVGARVRASRERAGLTQKQLADALAGLGWKIDPTALTGIEKGKRSVRVSQLETLAHALGVPVHDLLRGDAVRDAGGDLADAFALAVEAVKGVMVRREEFEAALAAQLRDGWAPGEDDRAHTIPAWLRLTPDRIIDAARDLRDADAMAEGATAAGRSRPRDDDTPPPFDPEQWMTSRPEGR